MKRMTYVLIAVAILLAPSLLRAETKTTSSASLSYVTTGGNTKTSTLGLEAESKIEADPNRLNLKLGSIYSKDDGETTTQYWYLRAKDDYTITDKTYLYGLLNLDGNEYAGYGWRLMINVGPGHQIIKTEQHELIGEIGPGLIHEARIDGDDQTFVMGRAYLKYSLQINKNASFSQDAEYLHDFQEDNNYRVNAETALTLKISDNINLKTGVIVKYVNTPPSGNETTDYYSSTAIVFTF